MPVGTSIEVTQATQFYKSSRHLHFPHAELDNSVPLIQNTHLVICAYPDLRVSEPETPSESNISVDGVVWFKRTDIQNNWKRAELLNGPIMGQSATEIDRGNANQTLNFPISYVYIWKFSSACSCMDKSPWTASLQSMV
jgi:hypothetical protein